MTHAIKNPRITEKASGAYDNNIYTFDVSATANKTEIKKAIFTLYKVKPTKVNVLPVPKKNTMVRGIKGVKQGGRKAVVYLKKGDKIEFI
jgi:large subunit ribosomal protein L23